MKKNVVVGWLTLVVLLLTTGCNAFSSAPDDKSEYRKENDKFVEEIANNPEYTELKFKNHKNKVYYKVIKPSETPDGQKPYQNSKVKVRLSGRLISGVIFQEEQDQMPICIYDISPDGSINAVVQGLQYALQGMTPGDEWEVVVPYILGFGANVRGNIPAYSTLIFTVELQEITEL